jgi:hypothetical protein
MTDFDIADHGSLIILRPVSAEARDWIDDNLDPNTQWGFGGAVIERRYFQPIYEGVVNDGLTIS